MNLNRLGMAKSTKPIFIKPGILGGGLVTRSWDYTMDTMNQMKRKKTDSMDQMKRQKTDKEHAEDGRKRPNNLNDMSRGSGLGTPLCNYTMGIDASFYENDDWECDSMDQMKEQKTNKECAEDDRKRLNSLNGVSSINA
ncbi:unnamed protein product [Cuscuta europaea]|uniref:Uncharacterized protein n=3 Tax=Cuscuta europaea TaxID=41803 RepID=A0A9P0YLB0_CUSEU|nr:unnamed protein product [Cuscuta europaea]